MKQVLVCAGLWGAFCALALPARGQSPAPQDTSARLLLKSGVEHTPRATVDSAVLSLAADKRVRVVVQLDGPLDDDRAESLAGAGVRLGEYLPKHAYLLRADATELQRASALPFVRWVGTFRDEWKIDPRLTQLADAVHQGAGGRVHDPEALETGVFPGYQTQSRRNLAEAGWARIVVYLFDDADQAASLADLHRVDQAEVRAVTSAGNRTVIDMQVPVDRVPDIANFDSVQFIADAPEGTLRNNTTRWVVQSNVDGLTPLWDHGLHGEGQIAGLIDGPPKESHCSFDDSVAPGPSHRKFVGYRAISSVHSHGTHTAGILAGDQSPWGQYTYEGTTGLADGMAYAARISFGDYFEVDYVPGTLLSMFNAAHADGARVHSNSWGDDATTAYMVWTQQVDQFSWENETDLVVFAVSNFSTIRTPENAKNVLAVGATLQAPAQDAHCYGGVGPTSDGRRKPEVFAPGCGIHSSNSSSTCDETSSSGTSMAAPAVAGMATLARQYYVEGFYPSGIPTPADGFVPSGALLKATVISSAVDMTGLTGYPSSAEGWGRVLMDNALYFDGEDARLFIADTFNADGLATGESRTHVVWVMDDTQPLHITLVWTEPPAALNASFAPINDLNLIVTAPTSGATDVYFGNVFDTAAGESVRGGAKDDRNNVERVSLASPAPGKYLIEIEALEVNQGPQGYALVVNGGIPNCPALSGDLDGDGDVDGADYLVFLGLFGHTFGQAAYSPCADMDDDGIVTLVDYQLWLAAYRIHVGVPDARPPSAPGSGDFDGDDDVDLLDFGALQRCFGAVGSQSLPLECIALDFDGDAWIDAADGAAFPIVLTGPD